MKEYDQDGNAICPECKCHYKNVEHKCPEWMLWLKKKNENNKFLCLQGKDTENNLRLQ